MKTGSKKKNQTLPTTSQKNEEHLINLK